MQFGVAAAIEYWLPHSRDPLYACRVECLRRRTVDAPTRPQTVVMLGSSRVQQGFRPNELGAELERKLGRPTVLFNSGVAACGPVGSLLYFERLRADGIRPDLLLIEVVPTLLTGNTADGLSDIPLESRYTSANRLRHHELSLVERYGFPTAELRNGWWQTWPVPCYGRRFTVISGLLPKLLRRGLWFDKPPKIDESGWTQSEPLKITRQQAVARAWREHGEALTHFQLCPAACQAQRDLLARCHDEGISVILVLMPEGDGFRSWYGPEAIAQLSRHVRDLSREFAVPIVDARRWVADEGFSDGHHLEPSGAKAFTERLVRELLEPVLALDSAQRAEYLASRARLDLESIAAGNALEPRTLRQACADPGGRFVKLPPVPDPNGKSRPLSQAIRAMRPISLAPPHFTPTSSSRVITKPSSSIMW